MAGSEGFAQPWLDFEKQIGKRLNLHGPVDQIDPQYAAIGELLVSKLTWPSPDTSVTASDKEISPGLKVRIYTPPNYAGGKAVCVFCHGGGWSMGDLEGEDAQCRKASLDAGLVIVAVEYRLAPKNPYPAGLDDCVAAYRWAVKNSQELNTKPDAAVLFGTSAGGNLAISTALRLLDGGEGKALKGIVAVVPVTVSPDVVPEKLKGKYTSYTEHDKHTINTGSAMKAFYEMYESDVKDPYVSPLLHKNLKSLPKTYISVCGHDTLRDDGILFKEALDEAGVPTLFDQYTGYPHWFWAYPSEHLVEPIAQYHKNNKKAFDFVLS